MNIQQMEYMNPGESNIGQRVFQIALHPLHYLLVLIFKII